MKKISTIAVIGGTGKSGEYLVKQLIAQGIAFKILLRNPENFSIISPLVEIVKGDARDVAAVKSLISSCHAVISTLGQPKGERSIFSDATRNVIKTMNDFNVKRYIVTTGVNVDTPFDNKSSNAKMATEWMKANYAETTSDKQTEYNMLLKSDLDWTLVRLPLIEQTDCSTGIKSSLEDCPGDKISATDLAQFLVAQLRDETFIRQSPFIASI